MSTVVETPEQMTERLEVMGLERVKALMSKGHFEPKTQGLVRGWIARKEEALKPPEPKKAPEIDPAVQEAIRAAKKAMAESRQARIELQKVQKQALVATVVAGAAALVAVFALFALAIG